MTDARHPPQVFTHSTYMGICRLFFCSLLLLLTLSLGAAGDLHALFSFRGPHGVALGPEIYFMHRNKEGGSKQRGFLYGARLSYDRVRRSALYWGADFQWAYGTLDGHNADHDILRSRKSDAEAEGRLGYTWKKKLLANNWFTPFLGGGYFKGTNRFISPSPLNYKICNSFPYITAGFLYRVDIKPCVSIGLNFKTKYSVGAKSKITDDPDPDVNNVSLVIEDKFSYDVDLPLHFDFCCHRQKMEISFVPFYRFRHYGAHENYPYDFIDTRYHLYGLRLMFRCLF